MKEIAVKGFLGLNNVIAPEDFQVVQENFKTKGFYLRTAKNVDIDNSGYIRRCEGYASALAGSYHSLWSNGHIMLARTGTTLVSISSSYATTTLRSDMVSALRVSYLSLNGLVYYSDGALTGVIENNADRTWGFTVPDAPVAVSSWGDLAAGTYQVVLTYQRSDGQESGAGLASQVTLTAAGGLDITLPSTVPSGASYVNVYVTRRDGDIFYLLSQHAAGTLTAGYRDEGYLGRTELKTQFLSPPPPGQIVQYYRGRVYIADGDTLWYSEPYGYELFNLAFNYIQFESDIAIVVPVDNGIYVGTEHKILFCEGLEPKSFKVREVANYGAIFGAVTEYAAGQWICGTKEGLCTISSNGELKNLTDGTYRYDSAFTGAALVRTSRGTDQVVVSLRGSDPEALADPYSYGDFAKTLTHQDARSLTSTDDIAPA